MRASPRLHTKHTGSVRSFDFLSGQEPLGLMAQAARTAMGSPVERAGLGPYPHVLEWAPRG